jgi:tRNA-dihydrouridine synthase
MIFFTFRKIFETLVSSVDIPVSLKIRAVWDDDSIIAVEYSQLAEEFRLSAVAIHCRTRNQFYQGKVNWDYIKQAQEAVTIPVIGKNAPPSLPLTKVGFYFDQKYLLRTIFPELATEQ